MVNLSPNEHIVLVEDARYQGTKGRLYLTNKRIAFEYEKRGIIFKGKYSSVDLPLERISEVSIVGFTPFKKLAINLIKERSGGLPRYEFQVSNAETWKAKIDVTKSASPEVISKEREVIIKEIIKVKCPYCGMLVEQNLPKCPNCGAVLT